LGGFYAQYLAHVYRKPYLMINPALDPITLFNVYKGVHINPYTNETIDINQSYLDALKPYYQGPNPHLASLLLLDQGDEVISYHQAEHHYLTKKALHKTQVFAGGDHAFQHLEASRNLITQFVSKVILNSG